MKKCARADRDVLMTRKATDLGADFAVNSNMDTHEHDSAGAEDAMARRIEGLRRWLRENAPECFDEQLHVVEGTPERAYWHYGYLVALRDMRALLFERGAPN